MSDNEKIYNASCHCKSVQVQFSMHPPIEERTLVLCNCSICTKNGYINVYPKKETVMITRSDILKEYSFNPHNRIHKFCSICGTSLLIIPNDRVPNDYGKIGINIRAVQGINLESLKYEKVDGWSRDPQYQTE